MQSVCAVLQLRRTGLERVGAAFQLLGAALELTGSVGKRLRAVLERNGAAENLLRTGVCLIDAVGVADDAVIKAAVAVELRLERLQRLSAACRLLDALGNLRLHLVALHIGFDKRGCLRVGLGVNGFVHACHL